MPVPHSEAPAYLASHNGVLGKGWSEVDTLEDLDPDEYELEEVSSVTLSFWRWADGRRKNILLWI